MCQAVPGASCFNNASQNHATRHFGSIRAVGLPVFPPVRLPSLASTRAPLKSLKPRPSRHCPSRLFRPAVRRLCLPQAYRARPTVHPIDAPRSARHYSPLLIYRYHTINSAVGKSQSNMRATDWNAFSDDIKYILKSVIQMWTQIAS